MRRLATAVIAVVAAAAAAAAAPERTLSLEPVAEGVWAVLQSPAERFNDANSLIVAGRDAVAVVDAQARPDGVAQVIELARQVSDAPVRYVINTHWHADHTQGNAAWRDAFGDQVRIVGHDSLFDDVPERAEKALRARVARVEDVLARARAHIANGNDENGDPLDADGLARQRAGIARTQAWLDDNRDARFVLPDVSYRDRMSLDLGGVRLELLHFKAHTGGDTVVWLPQRRLLATGDLLDDLPYAGHGYPRTWRDALAVVGGLGADAVVPGHGPVLRGPAKRAAIDRFLAALIATADDPALRGRDADELVASGHFDAARDALAGEDPVARRFFDAVLVEAIERTRATAP